MTSLWVKWKDGKVTYRAYTFHHDLDKIMGYCEDLTNRGLEWQLLLPDGTIKRSDGKTIGTPVTLA